MADSCPGVPYECQNAMRKINSALEGPFNEDVRLGIRSELEHCAPCVQAFDFETQLRWTVAEKCAENAPIELKFKIEDMLRQMGDS